MATKNEVPVKVTALFKNLAWTASLCWNKFHLPPYLILIFAKHVKFNWKFTIQNFVQLSLFSCNER